MTNSDIVFIISMSLVFLVLILFHYYALNKEEVKLGVELLSRITALYTSGEITESEYEYRRTRVFENFTKFQMFLFKRQYRR